MATECLFRDDSYLKECDGARRRRHRARRHRARPHGVLRQLRRSAGRHRRAHHSRRAKRCRSPPRSIPTPPRPRSRMCRPQAPLPSPSATRSAPTIDWDKRHARMRMHTALHLLSAVLPYAVTGGSVGEAESRLDFDIPEAGLDKDAITAKVNEMIASDAAVSEPLDQRRRTRSQSRSGQDHVGEAADGHRPRAADRDRRARPAAVRRHPCAQRPARSARCASRRSRRRASRTGACVLR